MNIAVFAATAVVLYAALVTAVALVVHRAETSRHHDRRRGERRRDPALRAAQADAAWRDTTRDQPTRVYHDDAEDLRSYL